MEQTYNSQKQEITIMQITKYMNMTKAELQTEIDKQDARIKNAKEMIRLLKRLQESAKEENRKSQNQQNGEMNNGFNGKVHN